MKGAANKLKTADTPRPIRASSPELLGPHSNKAATKARIPTYLPKSIE